MFSDERCESYYLIGIGGVSMSALAMLLHEEGFRVRGSDRAEGRFTQLLRERGIPVSIGEHESISEKTVVYSAAIDGMHPQLLAAKRAGKRLMSRAQLLGAVAEEYPHALSVAGCHGKTSAVAMLAHVFYRAGRQFTCHIGGEDRLLTNYFSTGKEYFLTEACEYRRSFLQLRSEVAVILNIDRDHTDCYADREDLFEAYCSFAARSRRVIVNGDDALARKIPHACSFGMYEGDIRAEKLVSEGECYSFTITELSVPVLRVHLSCIGKVHVRHALAAYAACRMYRFTPSEIAKGLESFSGVRRRFEKVGRLCGASVICDYAHHPREIEASLKTAQRICRGSVHLVFQPHTYSRTRDMMDDFVSVLRMAEDPVIYQTYAAREPFDAAGSAYTLVSRLPEAVYVQSPEQLLSRLAGRVAREDIILVLGAGDIYDIVTSMLDC